MFPHPFIFDGFSIYPHPFYAGEKLIAKEKKKRNPSAKKKEKRQKTEIERSDPEISGIIEDGKQKKQKVQTKLQQTK